MKFDAEKFSYRLTVLLDESNMTQTQLAEKIGTTNVTIVDILMANEYQESMSLLK